MFLFRLKKVVLSRVMSAVVKDLKPFNIVCGIKYKATSLVSNFVATYGAVLAQDVLRDGHTVSNQVRTLAFDSKTKLLVAVKSAIKDNGGCGMTADLCAGYKEQTYLSCTVYCVQGDVTHINSVFCKSFEAARKYAENIRNKFVFNLSDFGLNARLSKYVNS